LPFSFVDMSDSFHRPAMFSIINTAIVRYRYPFSNEKSARIAFSWQLWRNFKRVVSKTLQI